VLIDAIPRRKESSDAGPEISDTLIVAYAGSAEHDSRLRAGYLSEAVSKGVEWLESNVIPGGC
jgi:hypothetical protein